MPNAADPDLVIRMLTAADFGDAHRLLTEAFGRGPRRIHRRHRVVQRPGRHSWGTFIDSEMVAHASGNEFASWIRGVEIPTCGVGGVTVVAERRGTGLLRGLFTALLGEASARGETISTLFPTAPGVYRRLGYEVVGSYDTVSVPAVLLASVAAPAATTTRRALLVDIAAVRSMYDTWARAQTGTLTRRTAPFTATDAELSESFTGVTVAEDADGQPVGYAMWNRNRGPDGSTLDVEDLIALTPDAARALWRMLGTFASITETVRLKTSGNDVTRLVLPFPVWEVVERYPYMLRVHDVTDALTGLPLPVDATVSFRVAGDALGTMDGDYQLEIADGRSECDRLSAGDATGAGEPARAEPSGPGLAVRRKPVVREPSPGRTPDREHRPRHEAGCAPGIGPGACAGLLLAKRPSRSAACALSKKRFQCRRCSAAGSGLAAAARPLAARSRVRTGGAPTRIPLNDLSEDFRSWMTTSAVHKAPCPNPLSSLSKPFNTRL